MQNKTLKDVSFFKWPIETCNAFQKEKKKEKKSNMKQRKHKPEQHKTKQDKTEQNKTKQKAKQSNMKQRKTHTKWKTKHWSAFFFKLPI